MENEIHIILSPLHPGEDAVKVRLTPGYEAQFTRVANDRGLAAGEIIELSAGQDLIILGIQFLGAATAWRDFGAVLKKFSIGNPDKKITLRVGEKRVSLEEASEEAITELLADVAEGQRVLDESWERIQEEWNSRNE